MTEYMIKGEIEQERGSPLPMYAARCKKRKGVEYDSKGPKYKKTITHHQNEVSEIVKLMDGKSCIFMDTEFKSKGELGLGRCSGMHHAKCEMKNQVKYDRRCIKSKNTKICHQNDVQEAVKFADGKGCVFLEDEHKNKGELGLRRCSAAWCEVGNMVLDDSKGHKNHHNTSQHDVPETVELQYVDYFCGHRGKCSGKCIQEGINDYRVTRDHTDDDGNDDDPHYMFFLASTVKKGTSYMTKHEENALLLFIDYEKEDVFGYEPDDSKGPKSINTSQQEVPETAELQYVDYFSTHRRSCLHYYIQDEYNDCGVTPDHNDGEANDDDPHYMMFLASSVQKGASYMTKSEVNGSPFIHYEEEDESGDEPDDGCKRGVEYIEKVHNAGGKALGTVTGKYKGEREKGLETVLDMNQGDVPLVVEDEMFGQHHPASAGHRPIPSSHHKYDINRESRKERTQNRINDGSNNGSTRNGRILGNDREEVNIDEKCLVLQNRISENYAVNPSSPCNQLVEYCLKDQEEENTEKDYLFFLQTMIYENYAVKVIQNKYSMVCKGICPDSFVPSKEYMSLDETNRPHGESMQSPFRQKIINVLKMPYNQSEYEKLLKAVKVRKPVEKHMELQNGRYIAHHPNKSGKSYLDHYKDLNEKLKGVSADKHKKLNILRGFFFWLQNVTHVGAFKPWSDPACLAILPGSCN